jgi:hypothetical protein
MSRDGMAAIPASGPESPPEAGGGIVMMLWPESVPRMMPGKPGPTDVPGVVDV